MPRPSHLIKRFAASALPIGPSVTDEQWAQSQLLDSERELWRRLKRSDRRHAAGVARRTEAALPAPVARPVLAAALLHDVGKLEANFGTYRRTLATLSALTVRHDPAVIRAWTSSRGFTRRVGLYLEHGRLGGDLLGIAGSDPLTEAWAREHHLPESEWTVPPAIGRALKDADDD
jgi:hypothetical protein